jgi:hypothetical protein
LACSIVAGQARAAGDEDVRCMTSYEQGQTLKRAGKLSAARVQLSVCKETCPAVFTRDCGQWLREIDALLPTVRFAVKDESGRALSDVRVLVDGQLLGDPLPSGPAVVDAGNRVFRFERAGSEPVAVTVALQPGERDRTIAVTVASVHPPQPSPTPSRAEPPSRAPSYVLGTIGIVALATAGGLALKGHVDRAHLQNTCAPACNPAESDPIRTTWLVSGVLAGVGVASMAVAVVLWPRTPRATQVSLLPSAGGVWLRAELP